MQLAMSPGTLLSHYLHPFRHFTFQKGKLLQTCSLPAVVIITTFIIIALSAPAAFAGAGTAEWDFTGGSLHGWRVKRGGSVEFTSAGLVLVEDADGLKLVSPMIAGGQGVTVAGSVLRIKMASDRDGYAILRIKGRSLIKVETFWLRGGGGLEYYDFNLGSILPGEERVEALSLDLLNGGGPVTLQDISIFEASGLGRLFLAVSGFWRAETTPTKMINHIDGPTVAGLSFLVAGYILTAIIFIFALAVFVIRKKPIFPDGWISSLPSLPFRAFIAAFVIAAALFAVRMEYRWVALYGQDRGVLSDDSSGTRIFTLFSQDIPDFLKFLDYVKATVPAGETVRDSTNNSGDDYLRRLARYRLLPVRSSEDGAYILSYNDPSIRYDPSGKRLMEGATVVAAPVIRVGQFGGNGALYRVIDAVKYAPESSAPESSTVPGGGSHKAGYPGLKASGLKGMEEGGA